MMAPAQRLLGVALEGGWKVVQRLDSRPYATGGHFSQGYIVESETGERAFLKALDYSGALMSRDPAFFLQAMTTAYNFERDLLRRCRERRLDRVVRAVADGTVLVEPGNPAGVVQYLIFELADGDVRAHMRTAATLDLAWSLRSLQQVAVGLRQLHAQGIAHQDLKPSNVLVFTRNDSKVTDLGRASARGESPPHETFGIAGDRSYAPPELLYNEIPADWSARRFGCDLYLFGSMVVFIFTGLSMTASVLARLDSSQHPSAWAGTYSEVLPFVRNAFALAVDEFGKNVLDDYRADLVAIVQQLCEPDPALRGHPKNRAARGQQFSLERYVTRLDLLAKRAEYRMASR